MYYISATSFSVRPAFLYVCRCLVCSRTKTPLFCQTSKGKEKERRQEKQGKR